MSPLLLALGASLAWGLADFFGPLASRTVGTLRILFWAQIGGVAALVLAIAVRAQGPAGWGVLFAVVASLGVMLWLFAYYRGTLAERAETVVARRPEDQGGLRTPAKSTFAAIQNQEDAPPCSTCGSIMVRSGACYKCSNCGTTSGCA